MLRPTVLAGLLLTAGLGLAQPGRATAASAEPANAPGLITALADPDPAARDSAAQSLLELGNVARPALRAAAAGDDPQIRARAAELLAALPLDDPSDPAQVRRLLRGIDRLDPEEQADRIDRLAKLQDGQGLPAIRRVLVLAASPRLRWDAADALRDRADHGNEKALREMPPEPDNPAQLVATAWAWMGYRQSEAVARLQAAVAAADGPQVWPEPLSHAAEILIDHEAHSGRPAAAAELLRIKTRSDPTHLLEGESAVHPTWRLLALHAQYGPIPGLAQDLADDPGALATAPMVAVVAAAAERAGLAGTAAVLGTILRQLATDDEAGLATGQFLFGQGWDRAALRQYAAMLDRPEPFGNPYDAIRGHLRLSVAAERVGEYGLAAEHLAFAVNRVGGIELQNIDPAGNARAIAADEVVARLAYLQFRAAGQSGDREARDKALQEYLAQPSVDGELAMVMVPWLAANARQDDADTLYERALAAARRPLEDDPESPEAHNNLAWFMARCGRDLPAAEALSRRAVEADPDNAAYLDTLAEIRFRLGDPAEAATLETRALQLRPDDPFMRAQLRRFSAATR